VVGVSFSMLAAYYGGRADSLIMRCMDVVLAFPYLLLAIAVVAILGPGLRNAMIAIAIVYVPHYARVVRDDGAGFARGQRVEVTFDEDKFEGAGMYLFASVLERFLGSYVSLNSFSVIWTASRRRSSPISARSSRREIVRCMVPKICPMLTVKSLVCASLWRMS